MGWLRRAVKARIDRDWQGLSWQQMRPMYRRALRISWPAALEGLLVSIVSAVDTMMVGGLGPAAIAAVGLVAEPRMMLLMLVQGLGIGTTAIIARRQGAGNRKGVLACLEQSIVLTFGIGLIITVIGVLLAEPFARLAGANDETIEYATQYLRIVSLGFIPNSVQLCICAAFRGLGKTKVTLYTNILSNGVNVVFNYLLIHGKFGFPRLEVAGAAIATSLGTLAACIMALYFAGCKESPFHYRIKWPVFDRDTLSGLLRVGTSSMAEMGVLRTGFLITNRIIASLGTIIFASTRIISQVSILSFSVGDGIAAAGVAMVGQALGAKEEKQAMRSVAVTRHLSVVSSLLLIAFMLPLRRVLACLFTQDEAVIAAASAGFLVLIPALLPQNGRVVYSGCLRGAGDARYVALASFLGVGVLRPVLTWLFCFPLNLLFPGLFLSATGPWLAFLFDAMLRTKLLADRVKSGKWTKIHLK